MLLMYILSKNNIRPSNGILFQSLNITTRLCSSSDSSSDSSDSDSDTEKVKEKRRYFKTATSTPKDNKNLGNFLDNMIEQNISTMKAKDTRKTNLQKVKQENPKVTEVRIESDDLTAYVNKMLKERKAQKIIDVAIQPKKKSNMSKQIEKHITYENKLINAAEDVANVLGRNKTKTTSDLLEKVLSYKTESLKKNKQLEEKPTQTIDSVWKNLRNEKSIEHARKESSTDNNKYSTKKSIIHSLLEDYKQGKLVENSISRQLLNEKRISTKESPHYRINRIAKPHARQEIELWNGNPSNVFQNMGTISPNTPALKTWTALEQKELKTHITHPPTNIFQELILWTEQGKLWNFPIDNEQGMEEEQNVHFSEHVFMERHLKGWCPKAGPIRHFMELICNGLSKNPYLTAQEKINHIMWYKEYFESKEELLQEIGAIQEPLSDKIKEIKE